MSNEHIVKYYDSYAIIWFKDVNQFVIIDECEARSTIEITRIGAKLSRPKEKHKLASDFKDILIDQTSFEFHNRYEVNTTLIDLYFETEDLQLLINPKFDHLNVNQPSEENPYFVSWKDQSVILYQNNKPLFQYERSHLHELSGKLSMILLNKAYGRSDDDWLAIFHASFVSYKSKGVLIIGDSGSGKSTAGALLMASGMNMIADDFVPFNKKQKVNFFPAATSIKESAEDELAELIPELNNIISYKSYSKDINVKYIKPRSKFYNQEFEINAVISIKYTPDVNCKFEELSRNNFISELIPDTWTSPVLENVDRLMDWMLKIPAYQLYYSDNGLMINEVKRLLDHEI